MPVCNTMTDTSPADTTVCSDGGEMIGFSRGDGTYEYTFIHLYVHPLISKYYDGSIASTKASSSQSTVFYLLFN
jgi:hypothetical protein